MGEALGGRLAAPPRARLVAERRGLSNGFAQPSAAPAQAREPSRLGRVLARVGVGPRPIALGVAAGVALFVAMRAFGVTA